MALFRTERKSGYLGLALMAAVTVMTVLGIAACGAGNVDINDYPGSGGGNVTANGCLATQPTPILTLVASMTTSVTLSWDPGQQSNCDVKYTVYKNGVPIAAFTNITATMVNIPNLTEGTVYTFAVSATNSAGNTAKSADLKVLTASSGGGGGCSIAPSAPANVTSANVTNSSLTLSWDVAAAPDACTLTYNVYQDGTQVASGLAGTSFAITGLAESTTYNFTVSATDQIGDSPKSDPPYEVTTAGPCTVAPSAAPTGLASLGETSTGVTLGWDAAEAPAGCALTYSVYQGSTLVASGITGTGAAIGGLTPGTAYNFTVEAVTDGGASDQSDAVSVSTLANPAPAGYGLDALKVPQYECVRNWFLAPNGSDVTGDGTSPETAWATIKQADSVAQPGDCINLVTGTYNITSFDTTTLLNGGNANNSTGYVTYRSITPGGAILHAAMTTQGQDGEYLLGIMANYVILDGIVFDGNFNKPTDTSATATAAASTVLSNCIGNLGVAPHHVVIENNTVHGCGSSGIGFTGSDYLWIVNNLVYDNNYANYTTEGNGISIVTPAVPGSSFNPSNSDDAGLPYHIVIAYNVIHDNMVGPSGCFPEDGVNDPYGNGAGDNVGKGCGTDDGTPFNDGTSHTGGHGVMLQSFGQTHASKFDVDSSFGPTDPTIVVGNQIYNNGGNGVNVWRSGFITVANNSTYNNSLDPEWNNDDGRYYRGGVSCTYCRDTTYINNIAVAVAPTVTISPGGNHYPTANVCAATNVQAHNESDASQSVDAANIIWKNNLAYVDGTSACVASSTYVGFLFMGDYTPADLPSNLAGQDPYFNDPTATPLADLTLEGDSPAIGAGASVSWVTLNPPNIGYWQQ